MSQVLSFAEESCWDGDRFRSVRREIVFVLQTHQIKDNAGNPIRREFTADFGIFFDVEDEWLIQILRDCAPGVDWGWYVFHKKLDHSGISIIHPERGKVVGSIYGRGGTKQKLSGETGGGNVVPISFAGEYRARRIKREEARAKKDRERPSPEAS